MICYLVRHGRDDDTVRGGWSGAPLTAEGIEQTERLAADILAANDLDVGIIYSSDLARATQTSGILAAALSVPIREIAGFREVNNGVLAGMDNHIADERYPGLYWSTLDWDEEYPGGESPRQFFDRVSDAWRDLRTAIQDMDRNVILVTHGGVINAIQCIEHGIAYSNKINQFPAKHAEMIAVEL